MLALQAAAVSFVLIGGTWPDIMEDGGGRGSSRPWAVRSGGGGGGGSGELSSGSGWGPLLGLPI